MDRNIQMDDAFLEWTIKIDNNVYHDVDIWYAAVKWADSHPNWISVKDKLPPENGKTQQSISVWATNGLMSGEFRYNFDTKTWTDMWGDPFDITHWMLLPVLPQKNE